MARVWIDLDNAPHIPFFRPIITALESNGHDVLVTLRDYGFTAELAARTGLRFSAIGSHPGGNLILKVLSLGFRSVRLAWWAGRKRVDVAVSHGSRGLVVAAKIAGVPSITLFDYEHVSTGLFKKLSARLILPEALGSVIAGPRVAYYPGYKEEFYLGDSFGEHAADDTLQDIEDSAGGRAIVLVRPPATMAHYHDSRSEAILDALLRRISEDGQALGVIAPRTADQGAEIAEKLENPLNFRILERSHDGLALIRMADLVVGGGGTMNREAALLGVPVYSMYTGPEGAIDRKLVGEGRMTFLKSVEDVTGIKLEKRLREDIESSESKAREKSKQLADFVLEQIEQVAKQG